VGTFYDRNPPPLNTSYGEIRNLAISAGGVTVPLGTCCSWYHDGIWKFAVEDPGGSSWYFGDVGGVLTLHKLSGAGTGRVGAATCQVVGPVAWNGAAELFGSDFAA
jgi:hypothetical protein